MIRERIQKVPAAEQSPLPTLTGYELSDNHQLTVFLVYDGKGVHTRNIDLTQSDAGMPWLHPNGQALLVEGFEDEPTVVPTTRKGEDGYFIYHEYRNGLCVNGNARLIKQLAETIWPIMRVYPSCRPAPQFIRECLHPAYSSPAPAAYAI